MTKLHKWWHLLLYSTWFIVVWGAFVRASGSGDGCGKNWPTCHGELIPKNSSIETIIEFIHRATSGLYGIFVFALVLITIVFLRKRNGLSLSEHQLSYISTHKKLFFTLPILVLTLTVFEALIGAKLVLSGLVGSNESWSRAIIMIVHLLNTFVLVSSIVGCIYLFSNLKKLNPNLSSEQDLWKKISSGFYLASTLCLIVVAGLGALTALGDTLYPAESLQHGMAQDFSAESPWILKLRVLHPLLAVVSVLLISLTFFESFKQNKAIKLYLIITYGTFTIGVINLLLLAPIYMQLIHLLSAQALWSLHSYLGFELFLNKIKLNS